jgi:serine phosphatase RsbU (regulator of sigma subunit)/PAS domain-containing protein
MGIDGLDPRCPRAGARGEWARNRWLRAIAHAARIGADAVRSQIAGDDGPTRAADPAGVAAFTLDSSGAVASWSVTAEQLFGRAADEVTGRDIWPLLLARAEHQDRIRRGLAEAAAGRAWSGSVSLTPDCGGGQLAVHCEPLAGPGDGTLVIAQRAAPPRPDLLREAVARVGTTLDLTRTAREVTEVVVPEFADAAAVFVLERLLTAEEPMLDEASSSALVRRLAARLAGQPAAVTDNLLRPGEAFLFGAESPSYRAMSTGSPVVTGYLDRETADRLARRPGGREPDASYTSFLSVPLIARGVVLGCVTFARVVGRDGFTEADTEVAGELAAHAAVCIDNARLYHRERRVAFVLQQGLVPEEPRVPEGLEVAARYLPVGTSMVGGDWHDIVALPGGRTALIMGDAMGHGPEAAAVMVQLRTAAHALADLELPPEEVLRRLDRMAAAMSGTPYATCLYAVLDPAGSSCLVAKAGHPPPVLALPDGRTELPDLPAGLPLGLAAGSFETMRIDLPPGAVLALYTDGLVESRTRPLEDGLSALRDVLGDALAKPGASLDGACEEIIQALRQRGEDDLTLLLARIR